MKRITKHVIVVSLSVEGFRICFRCEKKNSVKSLFLLEFDLNLNINLEFLFMLRQTMDDIIDTHAHQFKSKFRTCWLLFSVAIENILIGINAISFELCFCFQFCFAVHSFGFYFASFSVHNVFDQQF